MLTNMYALPTPGMDLVSSGGHSSMGNRMERNGFMALC